MDIQTKDGILLRNIPDGTPDDVIKARLNQIRLNQQSYEGQNATAPQSPAGLPEDTGEGPTGAVTAPRLSFRKNLPPPGETTPAERIAANPLTQFALGAASPFLAAGRAMNIPGLEESVQRTRQLSESGRAAQGRTGMSLPLLTGEILNPVALTVGKVMPYQKVLGEGGGHLAAFGKNVLSGGLMGATTGGTAENPQTLERAGMGAAANVVVPPVISAVSRTAGWVWDNLVGRWGTVKASQILKDAAGGDISAIKTATAAGAPTETATQSTANVKNDVWDALGKMAERNDKASTYSRIFEAQNQLRTAQMRSMAGGATQTEARQAQEATRDVLNRITTPMRETELGAANIAGRLGPQFQSQAEHLGTGASQSVENVRRLSLAGQTAENLAQSGRMRLDAGAPPIPGLPRIAGRYSYGTELSNLAERLAQSHADDSLLLGQASRFSQMQLQSLAEHGLRPLESGSLIRNLGAKISDPRIGSETLKEKVLTTVRDRISEWTNAGGIIDAHALYGIRKSAVNDAIEQLMGASDPKSKAQAAAGILREVKPLIDDAIVKAGGTNWPNYLKTFEEGAQQVAQKKLAAKGLSLLETSPQKFESLAGGNEPKMVEKVFKTEYDINTAMGDKVKTFQKIAEELSRDRSITEGAERGAGGLARILDRDTLKFRLPAFFSREATVTNKLLDQFEKNLSKQTMDAIVSGMRNGKSANELLNMMSTAEKLKVIRGLNGVIVTGAAAGSQ